MLAFRLMTLHMAVVNVSFHTTIGIHSIGYNRTAGFDGMLYKPMQACLGHIMNATKSDTPDAFTVLFGCHNNQGLFLRQSANDAFFIAAPVGFVYLYPSF